MSFYVYATRRRNPLEEGDPIPLEGWKTLAAQDPSLRPATPKDYDSLAIQPRLEFDFIWTGHPQYPETWICWYDGNIEIKNPDETMIVKLLAIANQLGAAVISETGEMYNADGTHKCFVDGEPW